MLAYETSAQPEMNTDETSLKSSSDVSYPTLYTYQTGCFFLAGENNDLLDRSPKDWNHASTVWEQLINLDVCSCNSCKVIYMVLIKHLTVSIHATFILNQQVPS